MRIKLVIFDVDGTIFQTYSWQHMHENLGTWRQARKHSVQFLKKQITYEEWAQLDAALWKNQPLTRINQIVNRMRYTRGAKATLATLWRKGVKTFLLSAGLTLAAERVRKEVDVGGYVANSLTVEDGHLTGEVEVNVSFYNKDKHLPSILREFKVTKQDCAAVGDDVTLIPVFREVGLAIAFNPTNRNVEKHADVTVRRKDLRDVLPHLLQTQARHSS